jgi:hypothetical protein
MLYLWKLRVMWGVFWNLRPDVYFLNIPRFVSKQLNVNSECGVMIYSVLWHLKLTSIPEMMSHSELYIKSNRLEEPVLCVLCVTFKTSNCLAFTCLYIGFSNGKAERILTFPFVSVLGKISGKTFENNTSEPFLCGCNTFWCPFNTHK